MAKSLTVQDSLSTRFNSVKNRIDSALKRAGRPGNDATLIAISKTHPTSLIQELIELGATDLGENRVQEAEPKILELGRESVRWHLVGHLQANKAKRAVKLFDVIHSLDSQELAHRLDRLCVEEDRTELRVLIQVDLGKEATKSGIAEENLDALVDEVVQCERLVLAGLMTLPPFFDDPESARPYFRKLREIRDRLASSGKFGDRRGELSMGMTNDFEVAIEEGATMVRVGTALFGERH
jgi:pyridoxal phosphate enzyme (YggS family)